MANEIESHHTPLPSVFQRRWVSTLARTIFSLCLLPITAKARPGCLRDTRRCSDVVPRPKTPSPSRPLSRKDVRIDASADGIGVEVYHIKDSFLPTLMENGQITKCFTTRNHCVPVKTTAEGGNTVLANRNGIARLRLVFVQVRSTGRLHRDLRGLRQPHVIRTLTTLSIIESTKHRSKYSHTVRSLTHVLPRTRGSIRAIRARTKKACVYGPGT